MASSLLVPSQHRDPCHHKRNIAESVGNTIDNPVEIIECPSDLDSIGSDSPYYNLGVNQAAIKLERLEPGTRQRPLLKCTSKAKRPPT